jgi:thiol-disulfide isomerase/thioredoxin
MKTVKSILASIVLVVLVSVSSYAQSGPKVIAVINQADWCPTCKQNGQRAMAAFMNNNKDMAIQFVANDVTNDETKQKSAVELKKFGLDKAIEAYKPTGVAYFFNAETKAFINQISVAKSDQEIALAMKDAVKGLK